MTGSSPRLILLPRMRKLFVHKSSKLLSSDSSRSPSISSPHILVSPWQVGQQHSGSPSAPAANPLVAATVVVLPVKKHDCPSKAARADAALAPATGALVSSACVATACFSTVKKHDWASKAGRGLPSPESPTRQSQVASLSSPANEPNMRSRLVVKRVPALLVMSPAWNAPKLVHTVMFDVAEWSCGGRRML